MLYNKYLSAVWFTCLLMAGISQYSFSQVINPAYSVGTATGKYHFSYSEVPDQLVEVQPPGFPNTGFTYQWQQASSPAGAFTNISGATLSSYTFSAALSQTTYFRRGAKLGHVVYYSNVIKISVVSSGWEDRNYIREHDVLTAGLTTWTSIDQLPVGDKLQTTTYLDGIGRPVQKVSRETATPADPLNDPWGDMVQFFQYDVYGRQPVNYLPYTTTSQSGKFKTAPLTEQPQYYSNIYSETSAYSSVTFDNSPLNRVMNVKKPGASWAAGAGSSALYDVNTSGDDVKKFSVDYVRGNPPVYAGTYAANTLYKLTALDENGKKVEEFTDKSGRLILKKVQLDDSPADAYSGWICTYYVYDDFGLLTYEIQPEGVSYLAANSWSFAGANGQTVLEEQCFQYDYDEKGRITWKKAPGAEPLQMLYDIRDRLVFTQDGNQAALATPQWAANIYDELDRTVISVLYNTTKTPAQLQDDIDNATSSSITINNAGTVSVTAATHLNPISSANLNNASVTTVLQYLFYDNYSFNAVKIFNTNYTNLTAYSTSDPDVVPIAQTLRTISMPTGNMTRVLGSTAFLSGTYYYDEKGHLVQSLRDNVKTGTDISTLQYHFDGRLLSTCSDHTAPNTGYTNYKILTKYLFDKLGRVSSIQKQFGSNAFKTISSFDYDDAGRVKTKHLDPDYSVGGSNGLESLDYSFNIHNQLTGINKDYALKNPVNYDKWEHFFGLYLGFDNQDNVFTNASLNGQVTGVVWNTQGDDAQRRYDYTYDNAGRLEAAAFTEKKHTGDSWSNAEMDFSVGGTSGKITYDLNGNLLNMLQKGVIPGAATPITVDNLSYTYAAYSNKLQAVTDNMTSTAVNGAFGDFKDGANGGNPDYVYDDNGNLVIDLNKDAKELGQVSGADGIKYNFLDKPEQIRIAGKGTIQVVYSAAGEKLQRSFTPEPSGATITTTYINQFVYQESSGGGNPALQFINFEEGRIRVVTPTSQGNGLDALAVDGNMDLPGSQRGAYDYYIMDYLGNVRMILTEETHTAGNTCTMETADDRDELEESIFGQEGAGNEVAATRYAKPVAWTNSDVGAYVSRLGTTSGHNIGPNVLQKVMAGDKINASVLYYYQSTAGGNNTSFLSTMLGSLVQAISGGSAVSDIVKGNASSIGTQLGNITGFVDAVQPDGSNPPGNTPQAYLTVLFFDERFNFISAADGGVEQEQVASSVGSNGAPLSRLDVKAPKNGYVFVYVSNQSNNDVYFDNLAVSIEAGNIIEENHYYSYGLKIATLSSRKLGNSYEGHLKNNYLYQGAFAELDEDIGWNDFMLRNYDAQIGRWVQMDPYQQFASPYVGMGNDPINLYDPTGGFSWPPPGLAGFVSVAATSSETVSKVLQVANQATKSLAILNKISIAITTVKTALDIIGRSVETKQVGIFVMPGNLYGIGWPTFVNQGTGAELYASYMQQSLGSAFSVSIIKHEMDVEIRRPGNPESIMVKREYNQILVLKTPKSSIQPTEQQVNAYMYYKKKQEEGFVIQDGFFDDFYKISNSQNVDVQFYNGHLTRIDHTQNPVLKSWHLFYLGITKEEFAEFQRGTGIDLSSLVIRSSELFTKFKYKFTIDGNKYTIKMKIKNDKYRGPIYGNPPPLMEMRVVNHTKGTKRRYTVK